MRLSTTIAAIAASQSLAAAASTPPGHLTFFETEVRPLLADNCFRCHSAGAEKLKANLAFLGLQADVQAVRVNGQNWHRVRTGPYSERKQLFRNKKLLSDNGIDSISVELK